MTMRMLIDARHREETRVAVVKGSRIEEFDFESAEHKQLKGNIYLAKVTRVEPSLQAAFVDYGGNRHGFLAFSEIHPDYYQIPKEDREALLREEAEHAAEEARLRAADDSDDDADDADADEREAEADETFEPDGDDPEGDPASEGEADGEEGAAPVSADDAESGSDDSAAETLRKSRQSLRRRYKIQDVIRRRQVLLVQVVKEERGNKGAALTSYLSLAGRYCVLMPNTSHGGGISRKISNGADRKRLKSIMADLNLPSTMGCIVRTAGLSRTKTEIKRDFDYLARLWDEIREKTLTSVAPALIYGDSDLIKRAIRDIYNRDIDEVVVEGDEGYKAARSFMKLLMPSHVRRVKNYADPVPLFQRNGVEDQLAGMYQPVVQLKSGGYLVINPTEALVSIDINSGRSTREHNIEQTAFATNIEAANEIARQLRLRDMAGLVVIDFIDMESSGHIRKVEKAMKDALKNDRARIQVGRISSFGLMEMSRQRLRTGVLEASTRPCAHCEGTGLMRTASSAGLSALRMLEDEAARGRGSRILLHAGREAGIYVLNRKRTEIAEVEERYGVMVEVVIEDNLEGARMSVEALGPPPTRRPIAAPIAPIVEEEDDEPFVEEADEIDEEEEEVEERAPREPRQRAERPEAGEGEGGGDDEAKRKRRRRRGRRGGRRREGEEGQRENGEAGAGDTEGEGRGDHAGDQPDFIETLEDATATSGVAAEAPPEAVAETDSEANAPVAEEAAAPARKSRRRPRARTSEERTAAAVEPAAEPAPDTASDAAAVTSDDEPPAKPKRSRRKKAAPVEAVLAAAEPSEEPAAVEEPAPAEEPVASKTQTAAPMPDPVVEAAPAPANDASETLPAPEAPVIAPEQAGDGEGETTSGPARRGWWQRTFGG